MKKLLLILVLAVPAVAHPALFARYENVRQSFLKSSLKSVQTSAKALAADARTVKQPEVAKLADAVAKSPDMAKARVAFGALSNEMIKLRKQAKGARPSVYTCPMVRQSWLQPKGQVGNPYDASMQMCGTFVE